MDPRDQDEIDWPPHHGERLHNALQVGDYFEYARRRRTLRDRLADAWAGLVDGWMGR